jgi:hypothetical protein
MTMFLRIRMLCFETKVSRNNHGEASVRICQENDRQKCATSRRISGSILLVVGYVQFFLFPLAPGVNLGKIIPRQKRKTLGKTMKLLKVFAN